MTEQASRDPVIESTETDRTGSIPGGESDESTSIEQESVSVIGRLEKDKAELVDRLQRKQAELENYRKRIEREKGEWYHQGVVDLVKECLPVMDACERALASFNTIADNSSTVATYRSGVELIYRQFQGILKKFGVMPIEALGGSFDPYLHEAIARVESEEHEENSVIEELQKGYLHREKLLRPSVVKVTTLPQRPATAAGAVPRVDGSAT
ncbi:MAG: nucleotide exchange factor GrpE [Acidobacteria bacterium]|nr:nucleotide exchange factor GrpE [Acidobacteriota bacterium]MBI3655669.1 nucleotide exchange factor GrpE [Acidobacteriota bacterium]